MDPSSGQTMNVLKDEASEEKAPFLREDLELGRRLRGDPPHHLGSTTSKVEGRHGCRLAVAGGAARFSAPGIGDERTPPIKGLLPYLFLLLPGAPFASLLSSSSSFQARPSLLCFLPPPPPPPAAEEGKGREREREIENVWDGVGGWGN